MPSHDPESTRLRKKAVNCRIQAETARPPGPKEVATSPQRLRFFRRARKARQYALHRGANHSHSPGYGEDLQG